MHSAATATTVVCSIVSVALGVAQPGAAPRQTAPVTLESVMTNATAYVEMFVERFSNVVTEEHYKQSVRRPGGAGSVGTSSSPGASGDPMVIPQRREFRSDLIITKDTSPFGWIMLRDVFEVDGKPVRDREERLTRLLMQPSRDANAQAVRIADESARYNIGPGIRTTNTPEMSILFLQAAVRPRFTFALGSRERSIGDRVWIVTFRERTRPTLVRTSSAAALKTASSASDPCKRACARSSRSVAAANAFACISACSADVLTASNARSADAENVRKERQVRSPRCTSTTSEPASARTRKATGNHAE